MNVVRLKCIVANKKFSVLELATYYVTVSLTSDKSIECLIHIQSLSIHLQHTQSSLIHTHYNITLRISYLLSAYLYTHTHIEWITTIYTVRMTRFHWPTPINHKLPLVETSSKSWVYAVQAWVLVPSIQILTKDTYNYDHIWIMEYIMLTIN